MVYIFKMIGADGNHLGEYAAFSPTETMAELDIRVRYSLPQEVSLKLIAKVPERRGVDRRK